MAADTTGRVSTGLASEWVGKMSPRQVYQCPEHGEFEEIMPFGQPVPRTVPCQKVMGERMTHWYCEKESKWVPSAPNFIGGPTTGAKPSLPEE